MPSLQIFKNFKIQKTFKHFNFKFLSFEFGRDLWTKDFGARLALNFVLKQEFSGPPKSQASKFDVLKIALFSTRVSGGEPRIYHVCLISTAYELDAQPSAGQRSL